MSGGASPHAPPPLAINGWALYAHPLFLDQLEALIAEVEELRQKLPDTYRSKNATKKLAAINKIIFEGIPSDPTRADYRLGAALDESNKHWFRVKFFQQYRLFFRYHLSAKVICLVWVNDDSTLRAYDSKYDAYAVFAKMLKRGNPPADWEQLLAEAKSPEARARFKSVHPASRPA